MSGFRPKIIKMPVIVNGDLSQASLTSIPTIIQDLTQMSYALSWAGIAPAGLISIQVSNDYALSASGAVLNAGTWNTMPLSYAGSTTTTVPLAGNTGTGFIDVASSGAYAIRLIYARTSGTGTVQATFNAKVA